MDFYEDTKSTDLSQIKINAVALNSNEEQIIKEVGEPDFVEEVEDPESTYYIYGDDKKFYDLDFKLVDGKIKRFFVTNNKFDIELGNIIGKSKKDIIKLLGDNYYELSDSGSDVIGYFDKSNKKI
ncbi:hypothetical protein D7Z54_32810 [Salibacterium salarium]|uniref:Uncharacterized protein n=1 Tax=Salibacterium salarium TaxID=284579 RepID=A0A428MSI4_9BACI|nr:hypothetical protein [Salibacterium salarium]RSL29142.1 hypothetical protein D7Z54_32810 [Salibacterium salarium]